MHHLILGYGYCGYYLAQELLNNNQKVAALSRHLDPQKQLPGLKHITQDLSTPVYWDEPNTIIYYLIPPSAQGERDLLLKEFLKQSLIKAKKIIYFGSSGVYGNHQGAWITEESPCFIDNPRQLRRLDAEHQWMEYCKQHHIDAVLLRIAGIFGPHRLPIEAASTQTPLIEQGKAPYTNHIFVKNLARIAFLLGQKQITYPIYNIADGDPRPMGTLQQLVATLLNKEPAPYESLEHALERASPMKREFINGSKRLAINLLKTTLGNSLSLNTLEDAVSQSL
ncbi:NAD-dependent epimerase/dehydratase family protein [uncultured Legionella sp.]|uniref:NAD-dependent epimerase/dehydratase family protein n=1 Tax=uncultured Legionella sp. TaxID=210934 RepID=UPI00262E58F7|nr:NAD-dependent epimerase/dehydratase family protein [uncultured Legionella sp.]